MMHHIWILQDFSLSVVARSSDLLSDDINDMSFTNVLSVQIADW